MGNETWHFHNLFWWFFVSILKLSLSWTIAPLASVFSNTCYLVLFGPSLQGSRKQAPTVYINFMFSQNQLTMEFMVFSSFQNDWILMKWTKLIRKKKIRDFKNSYLIFAISAIYGSFWLLKLERRQNVTARVMFLSLSSTRYSKLYGVDSFHCYSAIIRSKKILLHQVLYAEYNVSTIPSRLYRVKYFPYSVLLIPNRILLLSWAK